MIDDENETLEVDGIDYPMRILRQLIRGIKTGCSDQCSTVSALQQFELDRRREVDVANGFANEQKRIELKERTSDD